MRCNISKRGNRVKIQVWLAAAMLGHSAGNFSVETGEIVPLTGRSSEIGLMLLTVQVARGSAGLASFFWELNRNFLGLLHYLKMPSSATCDVWTNRSSLRSPGGSSLKQARGSLR